MKTMMKRVKLCAILLFALCAAGCASSGPSADDLRAIRTITVAPSRNPIHFGLAVGTVNCAAFFPSGGLISLRIAK